ncbi:hypothetical protein [Actinoplanes xinjiangensis]|uniref:hypothetical protein n=1 Tax=Actinoplanes xinjiangensis TaxID=512350 RepID=UPI00130E93EF|nr:hypothetical protein [Actinoplanes xinjiangensis]
MAAVHVVAVVGAGCRPVVGAGQRRDAVRAVVGAGCRPWSVLASAGMRCVRWSVPVAVRWLVLASGGMRCVRWSAPLAVRWSVLASGGMPCVRWSAPPAVGGWSVFGSAVGCRQRDGRRATATSAHDGGLCALVTVMTGISAHDRRIVRFYRRDSADQRTRSPIVCADQR